MWDIRNEAYCGDQYCSESGSVLFSALRVAVAGYYTMRRRATDWLMPRAGWLFGLSARASLATAPKEQQAKPALAENFLAGLDRARTLTPEIGTEKR